MSRIGKKAVTVPNGVTASIDGQKVAAKGPKGELSFVATDNVVISMEDGSVSVRPRDESKAARSAWGMSRTMVSNLFEGVTKGFEKKLNLVGVGFRAAAQGSKLNLQIGFSHPVNIEMPAGITVATPAPTEIIVKGADRQRVGQIAAEIRGVRPPEPYKGKGIRYADEKVVIKETKKK